MSNKMQLYTVYFICNLLLYGLRLSEIAYLLILFTYLFTYLLHGAESFLRS